MALSVSGRLDRLFWCGLLAVVALFVAWQLNHLGGFRWDWDEGVYALTARTVADGHLLYQDIFSVAPPLFIASLGLGFRIGGETIPVGRAVIVLYSALGLLGVGLIAREMGGRLAGLGAAIVLAVAPHFYILSRVIVADMPAVGLSCLALWTAIRYERTGHRSWLAASGLLLSLGMLIKLAAGLSAPVIIVLVLSRDLRAASGEQRRWPTAIRRVLLSGLVLAGPFLMPLAVCVALYPWRPMLEQVVVLLWTQGQTFVPDRAANAGMLARYLVLDNRNIALNRGLTVLALAGWAVLAGRSRKDFLVLGWWALVILVILVSYAPLWPHLLSPVLFPLVIGAGVAVGEMCRRLREARTGGWRWARVPMLALLVGASVVYLYDVPRILSENARRSEAPGGGSEKAAVEFIQQHTGPDDYVITDEPILAFAVDRRVPPDLPDCSIVRIAIGHLTVAQLLEVTQQYSPAAIILWKDNRFATYLSDYVRWVEQRYRLGWEDGEGGRIYLRPDRLPSS